MSKKVAACVVLYHPSSEILINLRSYYEGVDDLIAIDNSEDKIPAFEAAFYNSFPNATYLFQGKNSGIAGALNTASKKSVNLGYKWLLTMDQDSSFEANGINKLIASIDEVEAVYEHVAIITPYHLVSNELIPATKEEFTEKKIVMTSGNLLNLDAYLTVGDFNENLFIDYVDYEYCLRLRNHNFKIIQNNSVWLKHSLGDFSVRNFLGIKIGVSNHNYIRRYYKTRNSLYVGFRYLKFEKRFFLNVLLYTFLVDPFLIIFYEKGKLLKLQSVYKGCIDFLTGKYGQKKF